MGSKFSNVTLTQMMCLWIHLQIIGVAQIPLAEADFIVNPGSRCPVAVDLIKAESAGLLKFVGGGVQGVANVGKAGVQSFPCLVLHSFQPVLLNHLRVSDKISIGWGSDLLTRNIVACQ